MRSFPNVLCLCLIGGPLAAQTSWYPPGPDEERTRPGAQADHDGEEETAEDAGNPSSTLGPTQQCLLLASTVPSRIPPGGSGTMVITMAMNGNVLITADTPIEPTYAEEQGHLTLGRHTLKPARPSANLGDPFRGQPVYDRSAVLEIPVHVGMEAALGKHPAVVRVQFELKDTTGTSLGLFVNAVGGQINVGSSVAIPSADSPARMAGDEPGGSDRRDPASRELEAPRPGDAVAPVRGVLRTAPSGPGPESELPASEMAPPGPPGYSPRVPLMLWLLLGAGGLAFLATATLLLRRLLRPSGAA